MRIGESVGGETPPMVTRTPVVGLAGGMSLSFDTIWLRACWETGRRGGLEGREERWETDEEDVFLPTGVEDRAESLRGDAGRGGGGMAC